MKECGREVFLHEVCAEVKTIVIGGDEQVVECDSSVIRV